MASSPIKRGRWFCGDEGVERSGTDGYVNRQTSMDRPARPENVKSISFELASTSNTPISPGPCPPLNDKKAGPLTKQEMEKSRQFGGDDYIIIASKFRKTNDEVRREKEAIIRDFEVMAKEWPMELGMKPIVFANTDLAIALVGKRGCRLGFSDGNAYLDIPAQALEDYQVIYMYKLPEHTDVTGPADQRKIYSYSGLITCGPEGTTFDKDVTLNFEHCAAPEHNQSSTRLAVFGRADETTPWVKEEQSRFGVKGNRVEHRFQHFSQRCYGLDETDVVNAPLRMCLMLAVSRVRRHYVEAVLMRDEISLINAHRDNFIDARGFAPNEVHVIRGVFINPTEHVSFEGTRFCENGPNDWNIRGFYPFIMRTAISGRVELRLHQQTRPSIAAISITEQGDIEIDRTVADLQVGGLSYPYIHSPIQVENSGCQARIPIPSFAYSFVGRYSLQTFDGNASTRERETLPGDPQSPAEESGLDTSASSTVDNTPPPSHVEQGEESPSNAERDPMLYEQATVEEGAQNIPETADENRPPNEEMTTEVAERAAHSSSAEVCSQSSGGPHASDGEFPGRPNGHENSTESLDPAGACNDRVVRRRLISTSSCRSEDGELLDREEGEMADRVEATGGGDTTEPRSSMQDE